MAEQLTTRDTKLIQYLNEAFGKEQQLEVELQGQIQMAGGRATYKKRLQAHLKETKAQARNLERRIKKLGGKPEAVDIPGPAVASKAAGRATKAASKAKAAAKAPVEALKGTGEAEKLLKNAKTGLANEYEEIANYVAIEELAKAVNDTDTAKLAREHRRQEERMASFLTKLLPQLTKAVVTEEIPAAERRKSTTRRRSTRTSRTASTSRSTGSRSTTSRAKSSSTRAKPASSRAKSRARRTTSASRSRTAARSS
jgi:ferritin-like metal-binding protein YciE